MNLSTISLLILVQYNKPKPLDSTGNTCIEDEKVELLTKYELTYPNYLLTVDEVGSNLYYHYDNNISREKYISSASSNHTTIQSNNNNYRFTVLGFTSSDSKPVICTVIMKAERLSYEQIQGIDITVSFF